MSTTALDRFLYATKADAVAEQLEEMGQEMIGSLDDLAALDKPTKAELLETVAYVLAQRGELERAMDRATTMVWDFVEENRPATL